MMNARKVSFRRRMMGVLVAGALLGGAALLIHAGDGPPAAPMTSEPKTPDARPPAGERRRTLPDMRASGVAPGAAAPAPDPVLRALPAAVESMALVIEANAFLSSPIGKLALDCTLASKAGFKEAVERVGIKPGRDLDRVAIVDGTLIVSGHFGEARPERLIEGSEKKPWGTDAVIYQRPEGGDVMATWRTNLMIFGDSVPQVTAVLERLSGSAPASPALIDEQSAVGDVYGVLQPAAFALMLGARRSEASQLAQTAPGQINLQLDTSSDVAMVAEARGSDAEATRQLDTALKGALENARGQTQRSKQNWLGEMLSAARPTSGEGGRSRFELNVPQKLLEARLKECAAAPPRIAKAPPQSLQ